MTETPTTEAIPVHIFMALDRTGSMNRIRDDVIGGFNRFLADQKAKPGKCRLTLIQFDDGNPFEILYDAAKIADVAELTDETYIPRGSTPLFDAEGKLIVRAEERTAARKAAGKKNEAIIFASFTDGKENASKEWTLDALAAKKKEHGSDWAFLYLGVGHDAYAQAASVGTHSVNTYSGARTAGGTSAAYDFMVVEVDNVRDRAAKGQTTDSTQTRAAQEADRRKAAADAAD